MRQHFYAPWSARLKLTTAGFLAVALVAMYLARGWGSLLILAIVLAAAVFAIRGYSIVDGQFLVHRLGWATRFDLRRLSNVEIKPGATIGSIRTLGIGGLFGFVGRFHNPVLGTYRAFATNELHTVVLDFSGEKIVVTPDDPAEFVDAMTEARAALP